MQTRSDSRSSSQISTKQRIGRYYCLSVGLLKTFFTVSFGFVSIGTALGIVRLLGSLGIFELIKPELKKLPAIDRQYVKKSFYSARHWLTMGQEMWNLDPSGRQLKVANNLGNLPISDAFQAEISSVLGRAPNVA